MRGGSLRWLRRRRNRKLGSGRLRARIGRVLARCRHTVATALLAAATRFARALPYALIAVLAALLPVVGVYGYRYVTRTPSFAVRQVGVEGNVRISVPELLQVGGLDRGPNLLALDLDAVTRAIEDHPWVVRAEVQRELPDRRNVTVKERKAAAVLAAGGRYLLDEKGRVFKRVEGNEGDGLPILSGLGADDLGFDADPVRRRNAVRLLTGAIELWEQWHRTRLGQVIPVTEIRIDALFGYSLALGDGPGVGDGGVCHLGFGDLGRKFARLGTVLASAEERGKRVVTVRLDNEREPTWVAVAFQPEPPPEPDKAKASGKGEPSVGKKGRKARRKRGKGR